MSSPVKHIQCLINQRRVVLISASCFFQVGVCKQTILFLKSKLIFTPDQGIDRYGINMITDASMDSSKYGQGSAGILESYQLSKGKNLP